MMAALSASCPTALKEWAGVIDAMGRGQQLVLIRKGGLVDAARGFEIRSTEFVFYPTFEHQTINYLRPQYRRYLEEALAARPPEGQVRVELAGKVVWSRQSRDPSLLERLEPFHIYNGQFLAQRLKWQPDQPLVVAVVRCWRLAAAQQLPVAAHYAGCKSWVELDAPVSLRAASPVLENRVFEERLAQITGVLDRAQSTVG